MPPQQRGSVRRLPSGKLQLRYYGHDDRQESAGVFDTKAAAFRHFRDVVEPRLLGARTEMTLSELFDLYVERHESIRSTRTIDTHRERMKRPLDEYGGTKLTDLETMALEIAGWRATLPPATRRR